MIAEKGFVENSVEKAEADMLSDIVTSRAVERVPEMSRILAFGYFVNRDNEYVIRLSRRLEDWSEYTLCLYADGSGYIVYERDFGLLIDYFCIDEAELASLMDDINREVDKIVSEPVCLATDDRYYIPVHMTFNIYHRYPDEKKKLKMDYQFDNTYYSYKEEELPIASRLIKYPTVNSIWMKMHCFKLIKACCPSCGANPDHIHYEYLDADRNRIYCDECGLVYNNHIAGKAGFKDVITYWNHVGTYTPQDY